MNMFDEKTLSHHSKSNCPGNSWGEQSQGPAAISEKKKIGESALFSTELQQDITGPHNRGDCAQVSKLAIGDLQS